MKVSRFKTLKHDNVPSRKVAGICETMMSELGFKSPRQSYYLQSAITSMQNAVDKAVTIHKVSEDEDIVLRNNFICIGSLEIKELEYDYLKELFNVLICIR